jgi:hypothetical protein
VRYVTMLTPAGKRQMNEQLAAPARSPGWGSLNDPVAFFCECGRPACKTVLWLTVDEFDAARREPETWVVLPGHELPSAGDQVVEVHRTHRVVRMALERIGNSRPGPEARCG